MLRFAFGLTAAIAVSAATAAYTPQGSGSAASASAQPDGKICQFVVGAEPGAKPYELCMTKAEWDAKKLADAADATRPVCKYQEVPGSRFRSRKICMSAAEWENQRQLERQAVERIQSGACVPGAGC